MNNIKIALENSLYDTYWDVLGPGRFSATASPNEKKIISEAKDTFNKYLVNFRKEFDSDERRNYAIKKLVEVLQNSKLSKAGPMTYATAAQFATNGFYNIMESVKESIKKELSFGDDDDALDASIESGGSQWTVAQWKNTLIMMRNRAAYQYAVIKTRETSNKQEENLKKIEMGVKSQYFSMVKNLLKKLESLVNGDNPDKRKLAPNESIPNTWLSGSGGRGPGGSGGGRGGRGGGRRYPGGAGPGEEGFSRESQALYNAPFGQKGRSNYLFVHKLLKAYGLDGDSKYQILMDTMPGELPSRPWWIRDIVAAMESIGGSRALFDKYVPALNSALTEIVKLYTKESGERYNPQQAELGTKYVASTRYMMQKLNMPELSSQQTIPERENVGGAVAPASKRAPAETGKQSWLKYMSNEDNRDKTHDELNKTGYKWDGEKWFRNNKLGKFVNNEDGKIWERIPGTRTPRYRNIGHMTDTNYLQLLAGK